MRLPAFVSLAGVAAIVSACAVQPRSQQVLDYTCEAGRGFSVAISASGGSAEIEISRMRFSLVADRVTGPGEQFSCSMLTLRRQGEMASVDMDGERQFSNCHVKR